MSRKGMKQKKAGMDPLSMKHKFSTTAFYGLIGIVSVFLIAQVFVKPVRDLVLRQFHLRHQNFATFALVHFIPPMYSFTNQVWYSHRQLDFDDLEKGRYNSDEAIGFWFNHYPLRIVTFSSIPRPTFHHQAQPQYLYVRSKYLHDSLLTIYTLDKNEKGLTIVPVPFKEPNDD